VQERIVITRFLTVEAWTRVVDGSGGFDAVTLHELVPGQTLHILRRYGDYHEWGGGWSALPRDACAPA
jgi:hypothetical protein